MKWPLCSAARLHTQIKLHRNLLGLLRSSSKWQIYSLLVVVVFFAGIIIRLHAIAGHKVRGAHLWCPSYSIFFFFFSYSICLLICQHTSNPEWVFTQQAASSANRLTNAVLIKWPIFNNTYLFAAAPTTKSSPILIECVLFIRSRVKLEKRASRWQ